MIKMKVLVTGGAGFVGRNLVRKLLSAGHRVIIFDNLSNSSETKISDLLKDGATLKVGDVTNFDSIYDSLDDAEVVIHLAAKIDVAESIKFPQETMQTNVKGTQILLEACQKRGIKNMIAASSAAVYGECKAQPITEDAPKNPISPYGQSKITMEQEIQKFATKNNLNCISLRFFNIFGKGQTIQYAGVVTKFFERIFQDKPLEIFGDGTYTRDFVAIDDVVDAIILSIKNLNEKRGNAYNIGTGKEITINDLAKLMVSISKKDLEINHLPPLKGDIMFSCASIESAKKELGFEPKISLKQGLEKLYTDLM